MTDDEVAVELAPLAREQIGPFLILGVDKGADAAAIEAAWAKCVVRCRKGQSRTPLADIHWARDVLRDTAARVAADADSLNPDLARGDLAKLIADFHLDAAGPAWEPYDPDPPAEGAGDLPEVAELLADAPAPQVPLELAAVGDWLDEFAREPLDPWGIYFSEPEPRP